MFNDTDLPKSAVEHPDAANDAGAEPLAAAPPVRFGRLALCVAAASALTFGVVGTVAYGVWFNHDQQAYADAMAGARQALGTAALATAGPASAKLIAPARVATAVAAPRPASTVATAATPASPDEAGKQQASWSGPVRQLATPAARQTSVADATPAVAASAPAAHRAAPPSNTVAQQQLASSRAGRDARLAQQERRSSATADARRKGSLFARMGSFFRRVSYRQHGTGSRQDIYSHP
ncbi:hypothetical protein PQR75_29750 [Paraburkholderia fungorum]|jgi:hypothetical protein|uniref:hypothetical protein n=1 Tax=Paraburkholderia fungorum TaxID=134537 RepID=UPI0038BBF928